MRVVMLPGSVSRLAGGLFTSVRCLAQNLENSGAAQISIVGHNDQFAEADLVQWSPLQPRLISKKGIWRSVRELKSSLTELQPDIVHRHFLWSYASLANSGPANRTRKYCLVVSPRGMLDPWALNYHSFKKRIAGKLFENQSLKSAACLHALNEGEAASIRGYGLTNPICVIPNGIDLPDDVSTDGAVKLDKRGRRTLLFLGRIHEKKGLTRFIDAWKIVSNILDDWKLVIAGWDDGGHEVKLRQQVVELGLDSQVEFAGPMHGTEKDRLLRSASAFVLPSFSEGLPMSVLEAWAYRLPVLMTDQCNLPIGFEENAAVRISADADFTAEGLRRLVQMGDCERSSMAERGYQLVKRQFAWSVIAQEMLMVYRWILGGGAKPKCVQTV